MDSGDAGLGGARRIVVRVPVDPVEAAVEADAVDAAARTGGFVVRGPLFGVAAQDDRDGPGWRVIVAVTAGCPQQARDSLNSKLWFRAKDEARSRQERRALLAAVARLETERVDELAVDGTRYRVVRAEEYAMSGPEGLEGPRPTDPEPLVPDWSRGVRGPEVDDGLVLDAEAPVTPTQALEQLALRDLRYTGDRYPAAVRADSRRAVDLHPDVVLLPPTFTVVERTTGPWTPASGQHATVHAARRSLDFSLTWLWPRTHGLISTDAEMDVDARSVSAGDRDVPHAAVLAEHAAAADRLRAGRVNRLEFRDTVYQIARIRRLMRWGPDGPEGPRPSDVNTQDPVRLHPPLDEDGTIGREP
ncbi:DUF5954 family protein [Streptomyces sp. NPDC001691]|uniref:DUF5954 family protein n=1 Tax=Streptomyces sp. NPDC001691 TaxID=3364600 RepID=UPI0036CB31B7